MINWIIVGTVGAVVAAILVHRQRHRRAQTTTTPPVDWQARRVAQRDHFVHQGILLSRTGVPQLAPDNFDSKWEHAQAVHRYMNEGKIPYVVRISARRSRPTVTVDGVTHHVAQLQHDGCDTSVLMCNLDQWIDEDKTAITDDARPATCLTCVVKSRARYGRS